MPIRLDKSQAARLGAIAALAAEANADNRRFAQRKQRSLPAYILSDRLQQAVPCVVRDLSSTGAKLELLLGRDTAVSSADGLPPTFVLYIVMDEIEVECAVAWRKARLAGVHFLSATRPRQRQRRNVAPAKSKAKPRG